MRRSAPSRAMIILVTLVTLILLVGSALLQRIVFRAEQVDASLYFSPNVVTAKPAQVSSVTIGANLSSPAHIAGVEVVFVFDETSLELVAAVPSPLWQTVALSSDQGRVRWLMTPLEGEGALIETGAANFGSLEFRGTKEGSFTVAFDQAKSIIAAFDPSHETPIYNAAVSFQDVVLLISQQQAIEVGPTEQPLTSESLSPIATAQKILSSDVLTFADTAAVLVKLRYPDQVKVVFGSSESQNEVVSSKAKTYHLIQLSGLSSETQYRYRVISGGIVSQSHLSTPEKSFSTTGLSQDPVSPRRSFIKIFPATSDKEADIIIALRDDQGRTISGKRPVLTTPSAKIRLTPIIELNGFYRSVAQLSQGEQEVTTVAAEIDSVKIGSQAVAFNSQLKTPQWPPSGDSGFLTLDNRLIMILAGLLLALFAVGLLMARLVRDR